MMRHLFFIISVLLINTSLLAQPTTTKPNAVPMLLSTCAANNPLFGAGSGSAITCSGTTSLSLGGTGSSTQQGALNNIAPTPTRAGDIVYYNGTNWVALAGNNTGTQVLQETSAGVPSWAAAAGSGTVTSITPGNGLTSTLTATAPGSAITSTGTLSSAQIVANNAGATVTLADGDRGKLITASNVGAQAYSIAQAGAASAFQAGWYVDISNVGTTAAGIVTVTPTTSTINGASTFKIQPGQSARIASDGANYQVAFLGSGSQLPGTLTNDAANAGNIGEFVSATLAAGSAVSLSTGVARDITTLSVTAGDWDCNGAIAVNPAGTVSNQSGWIALNTASQPSAPGLGAYFYDGNSSTALTVKPTGTIRVSTASTITVYLSDLVTFTSTATTYGFIRCRRVR